MQKTVLLAAAALTALLVFLAWRHAGGAMALAALIGTGAGVALYHASFGFTAAWRRLVRERRGGGLRAQLVLIGLTCAVTFPLMAWGGEIGLPARGFILPMGVSSAIGAFVFGIGMQLGGGCASGTLFTAGGGSTRMIIVLAFFIAGSVVATAHWDFWSKAPEPGAPWEGLREVLSFRLNDNRGISLPETLGTFGGLAALLAGLALIWALTVAVERRAHGGLEMPRPTGSLLRGPWSLVLGAVALAAVGIATMAVLGRPWGVTAGFALWGAQILDAFDVPVTHWSYWAPRWRQDQIAGGPFAEGTSVMNFGILLGAMMAAALAGKFRPVLSLTPRDLATAVIGGLLMGYGARLAYGCNIGAYLGGLVSGSLHGAWWLLWGFLGSTAGTWLRARLSIDPPLPPRAAPA